MRVPVTIQPYSELRERYSRAVQRVWLAQPGITDVPSSHPENVFDTPDNLRLIISHDKADGRDYDVLHVSVSMFNPGNSDWVQLKTKQVKPTLPFKDATSTIRGIQVSLQNVTGHQLPSPNADFISKSGVLHLIWDWQDKYATVGEEVPL